MARRGPLPIRLYRALSHAALPVVHVMTRQRVKRGKEDPERLGERRGFAAYQRPGGLLVWLHAASVGETATALPLIRRLRERGALVLLTTVTVTSARLAAARLPDGAVHQFIPFDLPGAVNRFLDHWQPDLALFMEQELWPNLLEGCSRRNIPTVLVNARMSPRSFKRWKLARPIARHLLDYFAVVLAQSEQDADRLAQLGAARTVNVGNIKYDVPALESDFEHLSKIMIGFAGRAVWTAASTHDGEEELVLDAHAMARRIERRLGLILAPRHPERGDDVETLCRSRGYSVARRSRGEWPGGASDIFLIDTIGELGLAFRGSALSFIGGSLLPNIGGHNPIEAAKLDRMVLHGPHVHNFAEVFSVLDETGGGIEVEDASALGAALARYISSPDECRRAAERARAAVDGLGGAIDRVLRALDPFFIQTSLDARL